jgi:hypothetical protein
VLWENTYYGGHKRVFINDDSNLSPGWTDKGWVLCGFDADGTYRFCPASGPCAPGVNFNDVASAVGVHPGPDYQKWKANHPSLEPTVTLFADANQQGSSLTLTTGIYPDLGVYGLNDAISSVRFGGARMLPTAPPAAPISSIPVILKLHSAAQGAAQNCDEADQVITLVEPSPDLGADYGFNDTTSFIEVLSGPTRPVEERIDLYADVGYQGSTQTFYGQPLSTDLTGAFNDVLSSVSWQR